MRIWSRLFGQMACLASAFVSFRGSDRRSIFWRGDEGAWRPFSIVSAYSSYLAVPLGLMPGMNGATAS